MKYTLKTGKTVTIPDNTIQTYMKNLDLTKDEAIQLWLEENDYEENEELEELDKKAKTVKIQHEAKSEESTRKKSDKPRTVKVSDEKQELFNTILQNLDRTCGVEKENITILKENKLIQVKIGEKIFKIDIIEQRPPKNK